MHDVADAISLYEKATRSMATSPDELRQALLRVYGNPFGIHASGESGRVEPRLSHGNLCRGEGNDAIPRVVPK